MSPAKGRGWLHVILKRVASVEEFGNVCTDRVLDDELAARVVECELRNVKNQVVKNHKLLAVVQSSFKLLCIHYKLGNFVWLLLFHDLLVTVL